MAGPKKNITKKSKSPTSIQVASRTGSSSSGRRTIDFSKIGIRAEIRPVCATVHSIGELTKSASETLHDIKAKATMQNSEAASWTKTSAERRQLKVAIEGAPVRFTHTGRGFSFVLIVDHSGYTSICGKTEIIKAMESFSESTGEESPPTVTVKLSGIVQFRWSNVRTSNGEEVFYSFNDRISATAHGCAESRDVGTSFGALLAMCLDPLSSGSTTLAIMGMVMSLQQEGNECTMAIQDRNGYVFLTVSNYGEAEIPELGNHIIFVGQFTFETREIRGSKALATAIGAGALKIIHVSEETKEGRKKRFESTEEEHYKFIDPFLAPI